MADTGMRDSGRFRDDDLSKLWNDMYHGNGKPGVTTRIQILEDAMERQDKVTEKLNQSVILLTAALNRFEGGAATAKEGMTIAEKILTGIGVVGAFLIGHLVWK